MEYLQVDVLPYADFVGCKTDIISTLAYCNFVEANFVTWHSRSLKVVARSSAKA